MIFSTEGNILIFFFTLVIATFVVALLNLCLSDSCIETNTVPVCGDAETDGTTIFDEVLIQDQ